MDAYHGSFPHKYRKKNGEMGERRVEDEAWEEGNCNWIIQSESSTVNFANNDCGYNDNSRITTEFPCSEQSPIPL